MKSKSRITSFFVERLYNTGNYTHVKFGLNVEVPEGNSVKLAVKNAIALLRAANPKCPVADHEYKHACAQLDKPTDWHKNIKPADARRKAIRQMVRDAKAVIAKRKNWEKRVKAAEAALDDIGGTRVFTDAKLSWDDNYGYEY